MKQYLLIIAIAALAALLFAGITAGSVLDIAPEFSLGLVERVVCPQGQTLEYRELGQVTYTDSEGTHNAANVSISCVASDGTRVEGKTGAVIGALLGLYFVVFFVLLAPAGLLVRWFLLRRSPGARGSASR